MFFLIFCVLRVCNKFHCLHNRWNHVNSEIVLSSVDDTRKASLHTRLKQQQGLVAPGYH